MKLYIFAALLAAAVHDVAHRGVEIPLTLTLYTPHYVLPSEVSRAYVNPIELAKAPRPPRSQASRSPDIPD